MVEAGMETRKRKTMLTRRTFLVAAGIGLPLVLRDLLAASDRTAEKPEQQELVFSAKTWEGDYSSKDVPGGVETTPVVGAVYSVKSDGTGLKKVVALGR